MSYFSRLKLVFALAVGSFLALPSALQAVPANPSLCQYVQPDGSIVTIQMRGDEFLHYVTTTDGYTLMKNADGYYVYAARTSSGTLTCSTIVAHDVDKRGSEEKNFLAQTPLYLSDSQDVKKAKINALLRKDIYGKYRTSPMASSYDYSKFRGLVILVEFNDRSFSRSDAKEIFSDMLNKPSYMGFEKSDGSFASYTGSVRDYFEDNSLGRFKPQFDVVGPVKIDASCTFPRSMSNARSLSVKVMAAADSIVDFSKYDCDGDGTVDMIYFICAGYGAHFVGNNSGFLWPHAWSMFGDVHDGVRLDRYACSTEMYGSENSMDLDGIGTICHEFSHVLGLKDEYDTDYEKNGGESFHPDNWSIMAGGNHINMGRTPVGYSLFQRYQAGFSTPKTISGPTTVSIPSLAQTGVGYRINSAVDKEYFLLENRQISKWDAYLPATGLLVTRVDSTNTSVWNNNTINCDPKHNYLEIVRAIAPTKVGSFETDVFPQPTVSSLTNETTPNMCSWTGKKSPLVLSSIKKIGSLIKVVVDEDKTVTDIEALTNSTPEDCAVYYDLSGRKCSSPSRGVSIVVKERHDGKRVVSKVVNR